MTQPNNGAARSDEPGDAAATLVTGQPKYTPSPAAAMTRKERDDLAKLTRQRAKLAKEAAKQRGAELIADGEAQLAAIFKADDARWEAAMGVARTAIEQANAEIDRYCEASGVPKEFRPSVGFHWLSRGENASRERRSELRAVLRTRVDALVKQAGTEIERQSLEVQTALIAGGLDSAEAREFLASMPTAETLMPGVDVHDFPEVAALSRGPDGEAARR